MQELQLLSDQVDALLKKHTAVMAANKKLMQAQERSMQQVAQLQQQLAAAEEQLLATAIARALPDEQEKAQTRKQLDAVITEIDKILTNLND